MKNNFKILLIIILIITSSSCNKTKQNANRLAGEKWKSASITIDGNAFNILPTFTFNDCNIYDEICMGTIATSQFGVADFAWQIRDKGKIFELSDQTHEVDKNNEEVVSFSASFSGIYSIEEASKNKMKFISNATSRYPNKSVVIIIQKQ